MPETPDAVLRLRVAGTTRPGRGRDITLGGTGTVALTEIRHTQRRLVRRSDGENKFGEYCGELVWVDDDAEFVVTAAEVLHEGVSDADHTG